MPAEVRACSRHLATVVSVRGEVTAADVDAVVEQVRRFVLPDTAFVLDLSRLTDVAPEGAALLTVIDDDCAAAGVEWALVSGPAAEALLDEPIRDRLLPLVKSVADALHDFADAMTTRRSLLLPMLKRSA
ncbi:hypothetical protein BVC93_26920 [Mycobacterium sp. MS1601]|uniref:STAS domain-containing protein n=1 Tax=Mycobacterium sp. MS1601 TaxID=1936029 RepID=UPI00097938C7|nr:STAS domain-containing protein [Mycobacterium sp. MS1601]AQA05415.1 hypothetical protein BVC93_26920 [Mycobacterium sp. MS1601]